VVLVTTRPSPVTRREASVWVWGDPWMVTRGRLDPGERSLAGWLAGLPRGSPARCLPGRRLRPGRPLGAATGQPNREGSVTDISSDMSAAFIMGIGERQHAGGTTSRAFYDQPADEAKVYKRHTDLRRWGYGANAAGCSWSRRRPMRKRGFRSRPATSLLGSCLSCHSPEPTLSKEPGISMTTTMTTPMTAGGRVVSAPREA
jgi:hypothetical protein